MSPSKKNIAANFVSNGLGTILAILFVPVYIHFLGIEAYGLIGVSAALQGIFALLDLGLSTTLNREMATLSVQKDKAEEMRNMVRTLELIYWGVAAAIGVAVVSLAPLIAHRWVKVSQLTPEAVQQAVRAMGLMLAVRWPLSLYSGGLLGLQRQVLLSVINVATALVRSIGAVLVLSLFSPTIQAFFYWQIFASLLQTLITLLFLWRSLPKANVGPSFQRELLGRTWRFAAGMSGISATVLILTQLDKVVLSKMLPLQVFGYYTLAAGMAAAPLILVGPVFAAMYPRFTQLVTSGDQAQLKALYHRSCQFLSAIILPVAIVIAFFSKEILFLWTRSYEIAERTHLILTILVIGSVLNGLMNLPYALQLAHGWTKLPFYMNLVGVLLLAPLIIAMSLWYGAVGAAIVWLMLNSGYALIGIQVMHRRLLKGEKLKWYVEDVGLPLVAALGGGLFCLALAPASALGFRSTLILASITLLITTVTLLATPVTRIALIAYFKSGRVRLENAS